MTIDIGNELYDLNGKLYPCSTSITMDFIGGKYKTVILFHLRKATLRYNELRRMMPGVTERTLSIQLKQLEEDGLISRTVYTSKPPLKVEYALTDFGQTLVPLLESIAKWGRDVAGEKAVVKKV
ncbi:winged helix-turn-helix transcriptional regulator [Flavobacterium silvaticum]|uniref:winged helix-turn-helix transcriptional regulator n=1 Tax=Flavobacterium silvaticum TaxID=1852020 RepID=UPI001F41D690|nr:helix-turn-helix domain-containing protein [Flavobacterium silvaticum]